MALALAKSTPEAELVPCSAKQVAGVQYGRIDNIAGPGHIEACSTRLDPFEVSIGLPAGVCAPPMKAETLWRWSSEVVN